MAVGLWNRACCPYEYDSGLMMVVVSIPGGVKSQAYTIDNYRH